MSESWDEWCKRKGIKIMPPELDEALSDAELYEGNNFAEWGFTQDKDFSSFWDFEGHVKIGLEPTSGTWTVHITLPNGYVVVAGIIRNELYGFRPETEQDASEGA